MFGTLEYIIFLAALLNLILILKETTILYVTCDQLGYNIITIIIVEK